MFFIDCDECGVAYFGSRTGAVKQGWRFNTLASRTPNDRTPTLCPGCSGDRTTWRPNEEDFRRVEKMVGDIVGFDRPEDGSQDRFKADRKVRPWAGHTFWWVIHNAVAHLLIAFVPVKPFFSFHDWTSRKMHGE